MNSIVEENYLKGLFILANEKGEVNVNDLSKHLDITMPTVTSMMKKLASKGLVHYVSYKPVRLTEKGLKEAAMIIRKHRLTEMYLVEKMGFGWEEVHPIAEQIEHIIAPVFFERMDELLDHPSKDPHGSPIPDKDGKIVRKDRKKLSDCNIGDTVKITAIMHASEDFLKYLNAKEIHLDLILTVRTIEAFDKSMVVSYGNRTHETLSNAVTERLLIEIPE